MQNQEKKKDRARLRLAEASEATKIVGEPMKRRPVLEKASVI